MPCMLLSPSWCLMHESPAHLFMHCPFASCLWHIILEAFGWSPPCRNITFDLLDLLASLLVGHPFGGTKKTLWLPSCERSFGLSGAKWTSFGLSRACLGMIL